MAGLLGHFTQGGGLPRLTWPDATPRRGPPAGTAPLVDEMDEQDTPVRIEDDGPGGFAYHDVVWGGHMRQHIGAGTGCRRTYAKGKFVDLLLSGSRAVVTGGTRGIGRAVVEHLLAEGCRVAFCARTPSEVDQAVKDLTRQGDVLGMVADVSDDAALTAWIEASAGTFGGLDIVVSNVSAQSFSWRASVDVDILSAVHLMALVEPYLRRSRSAAVVAIASLAARMAVPSYKPYSAVKAALVSFMGSLSREWAPAGIRVNVVSPGEVYYPGGFWERMRREEPGLFADAVRRNITGRMADPADVARAVTFLASPAAAFISGVNLFVDGAAHEFVDF